ncbi:MAG: hypothetical protein IPN97_08320 [Saprospiraceae bacterium]|nr:hypothetical protein [Saprospiraceae bacterium]
MIDFKELRELKLLFQKIKLWPFFLDYPTDIKKLLLHIMSTTGIEKMVALMDVLSKLSKCKTTPISNPFISIKPMR